jgi:hypothetical protein
MKDVAGFDDVWKAEIAGGRWMSEAMGRAKRADNERRQFIIHAATCDSLRDDALAILRCAKNKNAAG